MNPMVSIIIPVYNAEKTIRRCVDSVLNQEYKDTELLLVDDGSTDLSGQICDEYAKKDSRVCVIHKENTGVSDTRNLALERARGTYLQFLDSDDWISPDATSLMVRAAGESGCDMVISDYYRVRGRRFFTKGHIEGGKVITRMKYAEYMMKAPANFYFGVLWNKFFKADIIKKFGLSCSPELDWCEDFRFNLEYLQYVGKVGVVTKPLYYYVKTKGSLVDTQITFQQTIRTKRILFDYYKDLYKSIDLYNENRMRIQMFYLSFAHDKIKKIKSA